MGGAKVHTARVRRRATSSCKDEPEALDVVRRYLSYLPSNWQGEPPAAEPAGPGSGDLRRAGAGQRAAGLRHAPVRAGAGRRGLVLRDPARWAREVTVGFARLDGQAVGVVGNNSLFKGGVLFVDSADKATRFVQLCDAFNLPLVFLPTCPASWSASAVEKQGIIRHGAKMITAIAEATVPKICVVVRKAYGAGLYAMAGPGFEPDATLALPTAKIAVMGAEAAVNAVYANKIAAIADEAERAAFVAAAARSTSRTSTCCGSPASSSSTRWWSRRTCAPNWSPGSPPRAARTEDFPAVGMG